MSVKAKNVVASFKFSAKLSKIMSLKKNSMTLEQAHYEWGSLEGMNDDEIKADWQAFTRDYEKWREESGIDLFSKEPAKASSTKQAGALKRIYTKLEEVYDEIGDEAFGRSDEVLDALLADTGSDAKMTLQWLFRNAWTEQSKLGLLRQIKDDAQVMARA